MTTDGHDADTEGESSSDKVVKKATKCKSASTTLSPKALVMKVACKEWYDPKVFSSERVKHPPRKAKGPKPKDPDGLFCSKCFKGFSDSTQLEHHEQACFLGRCYPCPWPNCNHVNSQKSLMQQHYRSIHLGKLFTCRSCGKECTYKKTRDKHEKVSDRKVYEQPSDDEDMGDFSDDGDSDGSRQSKASSKASSKAAKVKQEPVTFKYNCDKCTFATDDKTAFSAHVASHLELKPFACSFCQKAFVKQSGLTKHIRICEAAQKQMGAKQQMSSSSDGAPPPTPPTPQAPAMFECSVTT